MQIIDAYVCRCMAHMVLNIIKSELLLYGLCQHYQHPSEPTWCVYIHTYIHHHACMDVRITQTLLTWRYTSQREAHLMCVCVHTYIYSCMHGCTYNAHATDLEVHIPARSPLDIAALPLDIILHKASLELVVIHTHTHTHTHTTFDIALHKASLELVVIHTHTHTNAHTQHLTSHCTKARLKLVLIHTHTHTYITRTNTSLNIILFLIYTHTHTGFK
jgi:hypothetical protein